MVRRKRCKPVHGEVVHPDDQNGKIDRQDPEHEDKDGVGVVVKIIVGARTLGTRASITFMIWITCRKSRE